MDDESLCLRFLKNPKINPKNNVSILVKDKIPYLNYIKLCRSLGYNDEVDELLGISKNKIGLFGLADIDQNIILNSDYDGIIKLLEADPSSRNLIYKLLPQILKNNNTNTNKNNLLSISLNFLFNLLRIGEVELIKRIWQILDDEDYINEKYYELGNNIYDEDQIIIENYLKSLPINYNLNEFLKRYLDKDYNEGIHFTIIIESINKILAAAINVKNDIIVEAIKEYWKDEYLAYLSEQLLKMEKLLGV
jgi:hypothetical protein